MASEVCRYVLHLPSHEEEMSADGGAFAGIVAEKVCPDHQRNLDVILFRIAIIIKPQA